MKRKDRSLLKKISYVFFEIKKMFGPLEHKPLPRVKTPIYAKKKNPLA